jgi:hypothetical protein
MVNSEELIATTEYVPISARCRINRYRYNRARLYICCSIPEQFAQRNVFMSFVSLLH